MPTITLQINGETITRTVEARCLLSTFLREEMRLTGTHVGCDTTQCGCCTVHLDGRSVKSCTVLAVMADGSAVTTIEGVSSRDPQGHVQLHPVQEAFRQCHALQCGFCTPGMVMRGIEIREQHPGASKQEVAEALHGNLCRCTGYLNIAQALASPAAPEGT